MLVLHKGLYRYLRKRLSKGWKIRSRNVSGMPGPESATEMVTWWWSSGVEPTMEEQISITLSASILYQGLGGVSHDVYQGLLYETHIPSA